MLQQQSPSYIPADVVGAPLDFTWGGASDHIGPTETVTPLLDRLAGTTTTGQVAMCAGLLTWGAWRFKGHADIQPYLELAEAAFAFTIDWRYANVEVSAQEAPPDQPPPRSALQQLNLFMCRAISRKKYWDSYFQPVRETFHSAHVVRHVLPKATTARFDGWLDELVGRVKLHWAKPDEEFKKKNTFATPEEFEQFISRHRGAPAPPQILDPAFEYVESDRPKLLNEFLAKLEHSGNRHVRSAEQMLELGFKGVPYRVG